MEDLADDPDGATETPFGMAYPEYQAAEAKADSMAAETADRYAVVENLGRRLFEVIEARLADEYVTRYDAVIRYLADHGNLLIERSPTNPESSHT